MFKTEKFGPTMVKREAGDSNCFFWSLAVNTLCWGQPWGMYENWEQLCEFV